MKQYKTLLYIRRFNRSHFSLNHLHLRHWSLLRHVNSIKELTQILITDVRGLLNLGSTKRNQSNIVSNQGNFILDRLRSFVGHTRGKRNLTNTLFSQKVTDLNVLSSKRNVDGEMGVYETHLVAESSGDTDHHVVDV